MKNANHRPPLEILRGWLESTYGHPFSDGVVLDIVTAASRDEAEVFSVTDEVNGVLCLRPSQLMYLVARGNNVPERRRLRQALAAVRRTGPSRRV